MEIYLDKNGGDVKVTWRSASRAALTLPYFVNALGLAESCKRVRDALTGLNKYVMSNPRFDESRDPGWAKYTKIIRRLRNEGRSLRSALFDASPQRDLAESLAEHVANLRRNAEVTVYCSDQDVTIPLGFVFDSEASAATGRPCRADFDGFWINRLRLMVRLGGTSEADEAIDCSSFRAIYALNRDEKESALADLIDSDLKHECLQFESLTTIEQRDHYDWTDISSECQKIKDSHAVYFVFAHCDGKSLSLGEDDSRDWAYMRTLLGRRARGRVGLVIFNCCASAIGGEGRSLLSTVTQPGYCGLIGTEAEVHNTGALRCGIRLMWNLCAAGKTLGEAFTDMQDSDDLFPVNLFYTCYADREFRLSRPITLPGMGVAA